ncbi:MAG: ribosome maturation factor RimP [Fibrobacter sp.]|nr:ribosome maturation factor RimP [Fibrobacter sp.]
MFLETREKLDALITEACQSASAELVERDLFQAGKRKVLRLYIDKPDGVTIKDCTQVSRHLAAALDAEPDLIDGAYTLEVSSPGVDRPLKSVRDFERNIGRTIRVTQDTGRAVTGVLKSVNDEKILLVLKGNAGEIEIARGAILSAKVDIQF